MINRTCPKCDDATARVRWDGVLDRMDFTCVLCGFTWSKPPLDAAKMPAPSEKS